MADKKRIKLIKSENTSDQFAILTDDIIGKGSFGTVYRAINYNNKHEKLVIKAIPIVDETRRPAIEAELKILSELPPHANLVFVKPIKCYSPHNYYILMEECEDGSLKDLIYKKKTNGAKMAGSGFSEQEIFDMFVQMVEGYKVLYDKKILHQDIKPQNILIKRGSYKLADFGLSIFYEGYKYTNRRGGTVNYIAPEKVMKLEYVGNPKSDIYSFGVIFFEIIVGKHPYFNSQSKMKDYREIFKELKLARLVSLPQGFSVGYSLKFLQFFDIIQRMVSKSELNRISFQELCEYAQKLKPYESSSHQRQLEESTKQIHQVHNLVISQVSTVIAIPFKVSKEDEQSIREKVIKDRQRNYKQHEKESLLKIKEYLLQNRIIIYFLDRFSRKLVVDQLKTRRNAAHSRVVLLLMFLNLSLINQIKDEQRQSNLFPLSDWNKFKLSPEHRPILDLIMKDNRYIEDSVNDFLSEDSPLPRKQIKEIIQYHNKKQQEMLVLKTRQSLVQLFKERTTVIQLHNRSNLLTLTYLSVVHTIVSDLKEAVKQASQLEIVFRQNDLRNKASLWKGVQEQAAKWDLPYMLDLTGLDQDDEQ